jgi:predicted small lipoprotein YifL
MNRTLLTMVTVASVLACGEKKPAKDPNAESSEMTPSDTPSDSTSDTSGNTASSGASSGGGGGAPIVNEKPTRSQSSYDKENTDPMLVRSAKQVKANCGASKDEDGKAPGPWGKVSIKVMLGHNGHVKNVTVPAPFDAKPAGKCIVNAFSFIQFPPWAGSDTEVDWEVELVAPPKEPTKK